MKPISIPDELIPTHWKRFTIGPPPGDESEVRPVEVIRPMNAGPLENRHVILIHANEQDLQHLQENGGLMWLQIWGGQISPFSIDPVEDVSVELAEKVVSNERLINE